MSLPRIVSQVVILGSQILGKAFVEAYKQAARNARSGTASSVGGAEGAGANSFQGVDSSSSLITRKHRMSVDEACQILNVKSVPFQSGPTDPVVSEELVNMLKAYERLHKANENTSIYILSKVVRAKDRISAEVELASQK
ncbi:uncharacterized protein MELLADRAFT_91854 [Melampsora larici-populina 98AG31]|uniref:Mitochondrial import inner membrane translocase subunit TIM16 n=1 Tax=Melampsora larici-populina (strain 98AG31 / pathotype 3-4-7) TaxID=747676 RepID=F4S0L5_MELLP|nr:uncharacterized protein MELLADRAFT_91854 [Melampsora larici-populina 98AG31]EGG01787.1 hypothetical protein MELLADRAFT_91854 [Melampsora larici-populina 98AG31]